jgi:hypothetical protein
LWFFIFSRIPVLTVSDFFDGVLQELELKCMEVFDALPESHRGTYYPLTGIATVSTGGSTIISQV